ncbi:TIGR04283 family arsenosugar biosynthesis glycosyltransferase [Hymenobacter defluvii]|uniref:TIGR04283 family arsenosugar biosynthesis glycosyltransferase n=1 Tax=Hymenobacter defluvii TaxID=2054411 RepID=A0ABS3TE41_9BACT|nr:TIGR04283 family arsenosugar biosynthesis glycosyltransferase [Hymenobacter defluvii]MBO3271924.1 TIGR04283 family arsenosugar biosynthesis glycosyltransferase [Hymenobacter defluvii]
MPSSSSSGNSAAPSVSIIIPTFNEADSIAELVRCLRAATVGDEVEILVADGQSPDATAALAQAAGARVVVCPRKGRAAQMNHGAHMATGEILYFLHADTYPPAGFLADIRQALAQGYRSGCYRLAFDHPHWFLRANAWFTRFPWTVVRFGDQSLFVSRALFAQIGGFREDLLVMEDQEIIVRLKAQGPFRVVPRTVTTSARKYLDNGVYRLQGLFTSIAMLYWVGVSQENLVRFYRFFIRKGKL